MAELPEFDSIKRCPKCGAGFDHGRWAEAGSMARPAMKYQPGLETVSSFDQGLSHGFEEIIDPRERMQRTCPRCEHAWDEQLPRLD